MATQVEKLNYQCMVDFVVLIFTQVVPSVNGIYFKDLKQTLRKEQCDVSDVSSNSSQVNSN